jgi:mannose/fructose/N-acetylgalactosamine-specific phosphotransferase system component IID
MREISKTDLVRMYLRSFFVQTGWTYDRMLALGFVWILAPLAKKVCSSRVEQREFLKRHLASFNANPYLASYAAGAVAKLEESKNHPEQITRFKESLRGPLGALGDNLIWHNLRPALLILGLVLTAQFGVYGALCVWILFNLYQVYLRARGTVKGYRLGLEISSELRRGHLQDMSKWGGRMAAALLGVLFVFKLNQTAVGPFQPETLILFFLFVLLALWGFKRNINPSYTLLFLLAFFLIARAVMGLA